MFDIIRKIAWIFIIILITVAAIPEIPSKGKQLSRISETQSANDDSMPRFAEPIPNVTVSVGRDALLACVVENLKGFKVAWVRVDTQTILSIHHNVITQNSRISLSYNDHRSWYLHIKEVEESDRGWYMCQVNTDPMRSRKGYLQVVVPPMIIESMTSNDMVVREGTNVTLMCKARGYPEPYVMWRREDGEEMNIGGENVNVVDGEILQITKVSRLHMAAYLCVASNGVPPSISKRVHLRVQFPPMLSIANQLEGAYVGQEVTLECETEAYPASINYWTTERGDMIISDTSRAGDKFETTSLTRGYQKFMKLKIRNVGANDFGSYRCVAKNSLGETDGIIKLDEIPTPTTAVVSGDITSLNRTLAGKRPHNRKFEPNAIPDYGLEEWKDVGGDTNQPPSVRHPPGAFHNKASSGYSINSYNKLTPTLYWLSRPFDGIKSSTLSLITTSFWWLNMKTSIPTTTNIIPKITKNTATLKNSIINLPQILIMSPTNKININNHQHNFPNINNNNLGKFSISYHYYYSGQQQQQQEQHQQKPEKYNETTKIQLNKQFKENTIMMIKSTIITKIIKKIIINDNKIFDYCCDSKKLLNNFSNINNKMNINNNVTVINITDIDNDYYTNNDVDDDDDNDDDANIYNNNNLILFLIQIFKRISFILYEKINFHIIKLIQFLRQNFHIFIMLALNLISVNLVKNILLLPVVVISSTTEKILFKASSSSSSLSTKTIVKPTFLLSKSSSSSTFTTPSTSFELEKILGKNICKRTLKNISSTSSLSLSLSSPLSLSPSSSSISLQNLQKIEYGNNSYKLMSFILNPSIQPRRYSTIIFKNPISTEKKFFQDQNDDNINKKNFIINTTTTTTTVIINNDSEIILNSNNINKYNNNSSSNSSNKKSNSNNISINNNISKSYNLNESIKMSKANVSKIKENINSVTITTATTTTTEERIREVTEIKNISRVNR